MSDKLYASLNVSNIIKTLYSHLSSKLKLKLIIIIFISLISAMAESFSLGMILPLAGSLLNPNFFEMNYVIYLMELFGINNEYDFILIIIISFVTGVIASIIVRIFSIYYSIHLSNHIGLYLANIIYRNTLLKDYSFHIANNSSNVVSILTGKIGTITSAIFSFFMILSSLIVSISIFITLYFISYYIAIVTITVIGIGYAIAIKLTKKRIEGNSIIVASEHSNMVKTIQEGLGNIRNIIIDNTYQKFTNYYYESYKNFLFKDGNSRFLKVLPKVFLESIGVISIALIVLFLIKIESDNPLIILGSLVFASQRLLPLVQQIYAGYTDILSNKKAISEGIDLMKNKEKEIDAASKELLNFEEELKIENISFQYSENSEIILENVNLTIKKGSMIGLKGMTGSGKSTLLNIIMGLTKPNSGHMLLDGKKINNSNLHLFHQIIAHVPQNMYFRDGTIATNISISDQNEEFDQNKIDDSIKKAKIDKFINALPLKTQSIIGERGSKLSGGQRQRIGLAAALYKNSHILILDEATNAVDKEIEDQIIHTLQLLKNKLTIILVSHNPSTIAKCDEVFELKNKKLNKVN